MTSTDDDSTQPWYRQFWPWFLIALPGSVVVASLATVLVAFNTADSLVSDNYYRDGMAINRILDQDNNARKLQLSAEILFDFAVGEVQVALANSDNLPQQLSLELLHPFDKDLDARLVVSRMANGYYRSDLETPLRHRYYLRLQTLTGDNPAQGAKKPLSWRLNGEIDFASTASTASASIEAP